MALWTADYLRGTSSPFIAPPPDDLTWGGVAECQYQAKRFLCEASAATSANHKFDKNFAWDTPNRMNKIKNRKTIKALTPTSQFQSLLDSKRKQKTSLLRDQSRCSLPMPLR